MSLAVDASRKNNQTSDLFAKDKIIENEITT